MTHTAENGLPERAPETRVEYGVIVDRTSKGLGYFLAETYGDYDSAKKHALVSPIRHGYPADVKRRTVTTTGWASVIPPAERTDDE